MRGYMPAFSNEVGIMTLSCMKLRLWSCSKYLKQPAPGYEVAQGGGHARSEQLLSHGRGGSHAGREQAQQAVEGGQAQLAGQGPQVADPCQGQGLRDQALLAQCRHLCAMNAWLHLVVLQLPPHVAHYMLQLGARAV